MVMMVCVVVVLARGRQDGPVRHGGSSKRWTCSSVGARHGRLNVTLESFLAPQVATILEHAAGLGVERPKAALAWLIGCAGHLNETVVE